MVTPSHWNSDDHVLWSTVIDIARISLRLRAIAERIHTRTRIQHVERSDADGNVHGREKAEAGSRVDESCQDRSFKLSITVSFKTKQALLYAHVWGAADGIFRLCISLLPLRLLNEE